MRTSIALLALALVVAVLGGCGAGTATLNLGNDPVIAPPVGTQSVSPTVAKFGPLANYLPPSGTIINYSFSSMFSAGSETARLQFVSYDNTLGTMTLDVQTSGGEGGANHSRFTFWIKPISGQSYCYKRKKVFYDEVRAAETSTFTPGALMGLFSASPASLNCSFTEGGHSTGSHSFTEKYLGTANIVAGATTYNNCVIAETSKFMTGDIAKLQLYWAPNKGPIMASLSPAVLAKVRLPRWCMLGSAQATSITTAK